MCSGTTFKFLCYFYACCNTFCAISIAVGADKVSEKITRDNCSSTKFASVKSHVPPEICNKSTYLLLNLKCYVSTISFHCIETYAALVFMLALVCFMSLLMVVGVALEKSVLIKSFRIFLYFNMIFLFGCWLAIFSAFYESHSSVLMLLWGFVLVLSIVYFGMQVWITSGAYEAISRKTFDLPSNAKQGTMKIIYQ